MLWKTSPRRLDELTEEWLALQAGITFVEASQRALLDEIQKIKEEEEALSIETVM